MKDAKDFHSGYAVRGAIDESLSGVRFDAGDMRRVLRTVRSRASAPVPRRKRRPAFRADFAFAAAMALLLAVPLGLFALRAQGMRTTAIVAAPGALSAAPQATADPQADLILSTEAPSFTSGESAALLAAKACFEAQCDTSIFTFDEYTVAIARSDGEYTVTMDSVYGNGCRFTVVVSSDGSVLRHSTPRLATHPAYLDADAPHVRAWYDQHGAFLFTWPQEAQAEFSRRYEGALLRTAREGELTAEQAAQAARKAAADAFDLAPGALPAAYPVLYAGRSESGEDAVYVVHCFASPVIDALHEPYYIVTLRAADGAVLDVSEN